MTYPMVFGTKPSDPDPYVSRVSPLSKLTLQITYVYPYVMYVHSPSPPRALLAIGICFLGVYLQDNSEATTIQASEFPISVRSHKSHDEMGKRRRSAKNPPSGYRT